jgi:hypothetical protein
MVVNFAYKVSLLIPVGFFSVPQSLATCTDGFTSPQKEVVPPVFIIIKNTSSFAGFEPANLGSNCKHDNH